MLGILQKGIETTTAKICNAFMHIPGVATFGIICMLLIIESQEEY